MSAPEFLFDFGSPNAYLAHKVLPGIEARSGVRFQYVPILLGGLFKLTNNRSPVYAYAEIPNKLAYEFLELRRFVARHNIPYVMNPHFPVNTLMLMRGAIAAEMDGTLAPYAEAAFHSMWAAPKKMDDPAIMAAVLAESGLDAERLRIQDTDVKAKLLANTEAAAARGAFGAPTFFVGGEMYFGKNTLGDVEEAILRSNSPAR